jgi:hypothetical protein
LIVYWRSVYTKGNTGSVMLSYLQNTISWQLEIMMSQWKTSSYKEVDLVLTLLWHDSGRVNLIKKLTWCWPFYDMIVAELILYRSWPGVDPSMTSQWQILSHQEVDLSWPFTVADLILKKFINGGSYMIASAYYNIADLILSIFASQGLRSALLIFTE